MSQAPYVIVGGSHGIGLGIVQRLVRRNAEVIVFSRTNDQLQGLAGVTHQTLNVLEEQIDPAALPDQIAGFAYCPGSINLGSLRSVKGDAMIEDFRLNVVGAVQCMQAVAGGLKKADHGAALFFSTVAVQTGLQMHTSVAAAKGAVEGITRTFAAELAPHVRVNCIAPALTDTPLSERFLGSEEKRNKMGEKYPLRRVGTVDDIAALADYLLGPESTWLTGQVIGADGGMSSVGAV
jgi:NAD(P)-dependent dehydrogenase (short-subunit alcohol dehydrogenase family)